MAVASQIESGIDLVAPFVSAAEEVFATMLQTNCRFGEIRTAGSEQHMHDVTAVIGLSGGLTGAIAVSTSNNGALQILGRMTGFEVEEIDDFVRDAIGEMANMIGGRGKRDLSEFELRLGLPQVIVGREYSVYSPAWALHRWVAFETELGPCTLDVGFDRVPS